MLHPSYNDLMNVVNSDVEPGEHPVVNSRYSIVLATAKRARQLIAGSQPLVSGKYPKPLSIAIKELSTSAIKIDTEEEARAKREAAALAAEQAATATETADSDEPEQKVTSWLTHPTRALIALIIVSSWQMSGYLMVIYIAGLTNVPKELIEAARVDGATGWQTIMKVKLPLIRNTTAICIFLSISRTFMSFDMNLSLTAGGPYKSTELIAYKIYQTAFTSMEFGKGQAQAIVLFVIVATISLLQVYFTKRGDEK